jgi:uncharacterized protein YjiS (DUF1127 family)
MAYWTDTFTTRLSSRHMRGRRSLQQNRTTAGVLGAVIRMIDLVILWQERAHSRYRLSQLDDRMLKDIGIDRIEALREAAKPFWRP